MSSLYDTPVEQFLIRGWKSVDGEYKAAFFVVIAVSVLAFGFEMTNLTFNHDDVHMMFLRDLSFGRDMGRFGLGWVHAYTQNGHVMPFFQMAQTLLLAALYGLLVARIWGARNALDVASIAAILCVFPYMAQMYQYNAVQVPFGIAHILVAGAVLLSVRATIPSCLIAAALYAASFSIYQSVIANAATILVFWFLNKLLFEEDGKLSSVSAIGKSTVGALATLAAGGLLYVAWVSLMNVDFDTYQRTDKAFSLRRDLDLSALAAELVRGSRSFFFWPENYFPEALKKVQLIFVAGAAICCAWFPKRPWLKLAAVATLGLAALAPRTLQLMHPEGNFHNLTLTAYGVVIAGCIMIISRAGPTLVRNASMVLAFFLVGGYVIQCNWISTVNYMNTLAHYAAVSQVLARLRSLPDARWDGRTIAVVGSLRMPQGYPFRPATGVASSFIDAEHMGKLAYLLRDEVKVVAADASAPEVLEYAVNRSLWPHPESVGVVNGVGVVVFSRGSGAGQ